MHHFLSQNLRQNVQKILLLQLRKGSTSHLPRQAGFGRIIILLAPLTATGGLIAYGKYDEDFQKKLVNHVPAFKFLFKDEKIFEDLTKPIISPISSLFNKSDDSSKTSTKPTKNDKFIEQSKQMSQLPNESVNEERHDTKNDNETKAKEEGTSKTTQIPVLSMKEEIPEEISELENAVDIAASIALEEYGKATKILKQYNEDVQRIVEEVVENADLSSWTSLKNKTHARDVAMDLAEKAAYDAVLKIERYQVSLSDSISKINPDRLNSVREKIKFYRDHINSAKDELYKTKDTAKLNERYWNKVDSARMHFIDQIEAIFPGLDLEQKKFKISNEDLDLFIIYAYSHVLAYQKELQRLQTEGETRLKRAIDSLRGANQTEAVRAQVDFYLDQEKRKISTQNQKKLFLMKIESEKELRKQLKRQTEVHIDHLNDALTQKENELKRKFSHELQDRLAKEKSVYQIQLAAMLGKLKGMETTLKEVAESEHCVHEAQALWTACQALWATVGACEPGAHWQQKLRPLKNELHAISKSAVKDDELVSIVLENLPKEAQARGVYPPDALRERFRSVNKVARKLAMIPEEGASLITYLLSYVQSAFILEPVNPISKEEIEDSEVDLSGLDTYDILNRASFFLDRGDIKQSVKYVNLLKGAPRKVALDWLKEARLLLETQQAANILMAHAASSTSL